MAAATLVATAFGIIIIIVTAYVLAGGTLLTSEVVINAQKDTTDLQMKILGTSMKVVPNISDGSSYYFKDVDGYLYFYIENDGREPIRDFEHIDIYLPDSTPGFSLYMYEESSAPSSGNWTKHQIKRIIGEGYFDENHFINQWDPSEILIIKVNSQIDPNYIKIVSDNGVSAEWQFS